jgi:hypothetical protein
MTANRYGPPEWPPPHPAGAGTDRVRRAPNQRTAPYPPERPYQSRVSAPRHSTEPAPNRRPAPQHGTGEWRTLRDRSVPRKPAGASSRRSDASPWNWLLLIPIVLPLVPGLYNRIEPTLFGVPFFYWCQLSFAFLASGIIALVHVKVR